MTELENLAQELGNALLARGELLTAAESCTGGWLAQTATAIAGSSNWFERGFVTYSNAAKVEMLGVSEATLARHGAVSEATARAMAQGALAHSRAQWSVAITGIAGPGGGSAGKPVGTVCFAWASKDGGCEAEIRCFDGDRATVREQAVRHALQGLLARLDDQTVLIRLSPKPLLVVC
ncbi:MAG: nicotinamide-nucleotide amidase [Azonexus sp.]|nr:nicotinamide-nucleotide amidase [Azonexus sp.]